MNLKISFLFILFFIKVFSNDCKAGCRRCVNDKCVFLEKFKLFSKEIVKENCKQEVVKLNTISNTDVHECIKCKQGFFAFKGNCVKLDKLGYSLERCLIQGTKL